jgi:hypothetical protein
MFATDQSKTFTLGDRSVKRFGYGAMELAGAGVTGDRREYTPKIDYQQLSRSPRTSNQIR